MPFEYEIVIITVLSILVMLGTSLVHPDAESEQRVKEFFARMTKPRPAVINDRSVPPPLGIIGTFTILIGILFLLLVALPQETLDRLVTLCAAVFSIGFGLLMKRRQRRLELAAAIESAPDGFGGQGEKSPHFSSTV